MKWRALNLPVLLILLSGCMVGPDYQRPEVELPAQWQEPVPVEASTATSSTLVHWWEIFDDSLLVDLIQQAMRQNHDLNIALARIEEARALRRIATADLYPAVNSRADARRQKGSENSFGAAPQLAEAGFGDLQGETYQVGVEALWELDLFGGVRRGAQASSARVEAATENSRAVWLSVAAEVALNYTELRGTQRRLDVAERNRRLQQDRLVFEQNRLRVGLGDELAVAQAESLLRTTEAALPPLRAGIRGIIYRLAVLTDLPLEGIRGRLDPPQPLTIPTVLVPVGLPSELLLRRPDLRQAERQLAAATADIGTARADLFPRFSLTGAFALESGSLSDLFTWSSRTWSLGPSVLWPIFQGGRIRANIEATEARQQIALLQYEKAIISALAEVESSLANYAEGQDERQRWVAATKAARRTADLAGRLYERGLVDFLAVLDAERQLTEVEDRMVVSETALVTRTIRLYKALGGGWDLQLPETPRNN